LKLGGKDMEELGAWNLEFGLGRITLLESKASNPSLGAPHLVLKV
jgi:hypothetical protein